MNRSINAPSTPTNQPTHSNDAPKSRHTHQVANNVKSYALYARMEFLPVGSCLSMEGFVYEWLEPDPRT
jgi:hypothetical protein